MKTEEAKRILNQYLCWYRNLKNQTIVTQLPTDPEMAASVKVALTHMDTHTKCPKASLKQKIESREPHDYEMESAVRDAVLDVLQQLHRDLKGFESMRFFTPDVNTGIEIAIEQVERYIKEGGEQ